MWHEFLGGFNDLIGRGDETLSAGEMVLRVILIYIIAILLVRLGEKRFMGKNTALDMILSIVLGSVLSRAITGNSPFLPTLAAGAMLVALHALFASLSYHWSRFGHLVKGMERVLIQDGEVQREAMRKGKITSHDLERALYTNGGVTDASQVQIARLERNGEISVIPKKGTPKVLEIQVREGVQTVRIELG